MHFAEDTFDVIMWILFTISHFISSIIFLSNFPQDEDIDAHVHDFQQQVARDSRRSPANNMSSVSLDFNQGDAVEEYNDAQV